MSLNATTQYQLRNLHRSDPGFLQQTLKDVAGGDPLALAALSEKTGVTDAAQLKEAAAIFVSQSIDAVFAVGASADVRNTIGSGSASTFSPTSGGVGAGRMNAILAARGGGVDLGALKGELSKLDDKKAGFEKELKGLNDDLAATKKELAELAPNWRERNLNGFFASMFGADGDKARKHGELEDKIESLGQQIQSKQGEINRIPREKRQAAADALKLAGDTRFRDLSTQVDRVSDMDDALDGFLGKISHAISEIESAQFHERMEASRESAHDLQHHSGHGAGHAGTHRGPQLPGLGGFNDPNWMSNNANRDADAAVRDVMNTAPLIESAMSQYTGDVGAGRLRLPRTTSSGNDMDRWGDFLSHGNILGRLGSMSVLSNLGNMESEMRSLHGQVGGWARRVNGHLSALTAERDRYLDQTVAQAEA